VAQDRHTVELIARHFIAAARPLTEAAASPGLFRRMMARLGFSATGIAPAYATLATTVANAISAVEALPPSPSFEEVWALLDKAKGVYQAIDALGASPPPPGADAAAYAAEIGERLFELLLTDYLSAEHTAAFNILSMLKVVSLETVAATPTRPGFVRTRFDWAALPQAIASPKDLPERVFGWGTPAFDVHGALDQIAGLFLGLDFPVRMRRATEALVLAYAGTPGDFADVPPPSLELPFFHGRAGDQDFEAAFVFRPLPPQGGALPGIVIEPRLPAALPLDVQLHPKARMRVRAGSNAGALFGITVRPGEIALRYPLAPGTPPPSAGIGVGFDFTPSAPVTVLGDPKASRVEFGGASIDFGGDFTGTRLSLTLGAELTGLAVVLDTRESDGFLQKVIGARETRVGLPLGLIWSENDGIRFKGSASFEVAVHPHLSLGPISVDTIEVRLAASVGAGDPKLKLEVGAAIRGELPPLKFFVRGLGMRAEAVVRRGNAGPFDIALGIKPPEGIGLEIDGGGFTGGGFLDLDPVKGEYSGGLELSFQGALSLRALGVLSTKLPDGGEGFSLLIIIVSEFPPIQLSWGFTLLGVGGLLGLNRTMLLDVLQTGVRDGTLQSILFPRDVVANATRVIGDLKRVFPPAQGRFLIGPMARLGWGTPTMVSLELGLLLEIPRPAFAIVGVLRVGMPTEDAAILYLQVSFVGSVDFERGQLQFDASLYGSRVLIFPLTGDMAVRLYWKDKPNFLLSVGGFHPAFTPPPMNIGTMKRLGIVIFQGNPTLRAEAYFAVTSNTLQFGARVELYAGADIFNVYGFLSLDVLIQFDPFHFIAEVSAMLAVRTGKSTLFAVRLSGTLEGPTPWHARGSASFEIGFIITVTIRVKFDVTIGDERDTPLPAMAVLSRMLEALSAPDNWRAIFPPAYHQHVMLREMKPVPGRLVLHPFGSLEIRQKVVPLHVAVQRIGSQTPSDGNTFSVTDLTLGGAPASSQKLMEQFAPAQFFEMTDAEKLSRPSFAEYEAGLLVGAGTGVHVDFMRVREVVYELFYLPERHPLRLLVSLSAKLLGSVLAGSAAARSPLSAARKAASQLAAAPATLHSERFAVARTDDMRVVGPQLIFDSAVAADQALRAMVADRPELADRLQVAPMTIVASAELRRAA
jgi:hypothetical protein